MTTHVYEPVESDPSTQSPIGPNQDPPNQDPPSTEPTGEPNVEPNVEAVPAIIAEPADTRLGQAREAAERELRARLIAQAVQSANVADIRAVTNAVRALADADATCASTADEATLRPLIESLVARVRISHPSLFATTIDESQRATSLMAATAPRASALAHLAQVESRARAANDRRALLEYLRARRGALAPR